ncbi:GNAT family N-acetyltransferase [Oceanobacillus halophilus]|uniref:N-acetyltransferase n=1 Tax=Oceanobacillus halophilus TaxID=930130 RepID=A0A495A680_9BACI|nr:GNAT family protein [Oceanobacillus halophilus]RKQ34674.1 N-acetyltransferase [Oceanobacillus halophilus]
MKFQKLETERLRLVKVTEKYTEQFYNVLSRDEVIKYYGMDPLKSIDQALMIIQSFQETFESRRGIRWGIVLKETGDFIGTVGLNNLNFRNKRADIGFELHPAHWRKGITIEAVQEVFRYSFNNLNIYRMGAITFPQNEASIQLLMRLGFKKEGVLRGYLYQNNQSHDAFIFSLLQNEWENKGESP